MNTITIQTRLVRAAMVMADIPDTELSSVVLPSEQPADFTEPAWRIRATGDQLMTFGAELVALVAEQTGCGWQRAVERIGELGHHLRVHGITQSGVMTLVFIDSTLED